MASNNNDLLMAYSSQSTVKIDSDSDTCYEFYSRKRCVDSCKNEDKMDLIEPKRCCTHTTSWVICPLASLGCIEKINYEDLQEHYSSLKHQTFLMKAIENYVRKLHEHPMTCCDEAEERKEYREEIFESMNSLVNGFQALLHDNLQVQENISKIQEKCSTLENTVDNLKLSINESDQYINILKLNQTAIELEVSSMKNSIAQSIGTNAFDGKFTWKINNVAQRFSEAETEHQASFYSPPFYSSPTGYKMCLRLYLNGDGSAKRTHISLFFVLLRGDYDAIVSWPFSYKVIFYLHDQSDNRSHIIDSFRPDIKSTSFQRPTSNMNIASGIPRFFPISTLKQPDNPYVRDDTMFISCIVDFESLPKSFLSTMAQLNPALPKHYYSTLAQSELVKHEKEKLNTSIADK